MILSIDNVIGNLTVMGGEVSSKQPPSNIVTKPYIVDEEDIEATKEPELPSDTSLITDTPIIRNRIAKPITFKTYLGTDKNNPVVLLENYYVIPNSVDILMIEDAPIPIGYVLFNHKYGLKFYFPVPGHKELRNKMFVVPCVVEPNHIYKLKDYTDIVPEEWAKSFAQYAIRRPKDYATELQYGPNTVIDINSVKNIQIKFSFHFTVYGDISVTQSMATPFTVDFIYTLKAERVEDLQNSSVIVNIVEPIR